MKWNRNSLRSYHWVINTVCIQFSFDVRDWDISDITLTGLDTLVKSNSRVYHKVEENILRCSWIKTLQAASENEYFVVVRIRLVSFPFVFVFLLYVSLEHAVFFSGLWIYSLDNVWRTQLLVSHQWKQFNLAVLLPFKTYFSWFSRT